MNELSDLNELDEESDSPERERAAKRTTWVSVAVNLGLTLTQVIAGLWSGSQASKSTGTSPWPKVTKSPSAPSPPSRRATPSCI